MFKGQRVTGIVFVSSCLSRPLNRKMQFCMQFRMQKRILLCHIDENIKMKINKTLILENHQISKRFY